MYLTLIPIHKGHGWKHDVLYINGHFISFPSKKECLEIDLTRGRAEVVDKLKKKVFCRNLNEIIWGWELNIKNTLKKKHFQKHFLHQNLPQ